MQTSKRPIIFGRDFSIQNCIGISWTKTNTHQLTQNNEVIAKTAEYQTRSRASVSLKRNIKVHQLDRELPRNSIPERKRQEKFSEFFENPFMQKNDDFLKSPAEAAVHRKVLLEDKNISPKTQESFDSWCAAWWPCPPSPGTTASPWH